jgi:purine-nucleoside/S-methyl-5'-thioadenosine phosphorylase / adenosine deaminase
MNAEELAFDLPGGARALFTTRAQGNLSSAGGEEAEHGVGARERLREQLGVRRLARGHQVHGTVVQRVRTDAQAGDGVEADGQATALRSVGAMVLTADCLPIAFGTSGAVAMVHAGWRGLAAGVLEEGVRAVREMDGVDDILAIIGPGAGPCCYEVGEEVHTAFGGAHRIGTPPTQRIDLKAIARERLLAVGVTEVRDVAVCTICDERFFSYRREGARAGRQGAVAWLS